jgi:lipopolysaccharide biosynthesis regulator YciM
LKALVASVFALVIGLSVGWYIGHRHAERDGDDAVRQFMQAYEGEETMEANRHLLALSMIYCGDTENTVRLLCRAEASFYCEYASLTHNDEQTTRALARIERFSRTNNYMAAVISNELSNELTSSGIRKNGK